MTWENGIFIINLKNYSETSGQNTIRIASEAEKVAKELDVRILISPPQVFLGLVSNNTHAEVISQHVDSELVGASTGYVIPEMIKEAKGIGSIINHSEHPIEISLIKPLIERLRNLGLMSVVCAKNIGELKDISTMAPDYVAIEPPELIGTKKSISSEKPSLIKESFEHLSSTASKSKLICGAGINSPEDIRVALDLGANGILAASSIVKAENWYSKIYELAEQFKVK